MESLEQGRVIAGRYRLERPLAKGGMGSVWVARHLQLDVDVAVKFMSPQLAASEQARARFEREAKAAALLKMANAVNVSDYGVEGGTPFMVMELLEGEDLHERLRRTGTLAPAQIRAVLEPVCKVLRRAHELGLVHRDLKPGNIFLARQGTDEIVKVLDFGIAKDTGSALGGAATQTGAMLGSPHYMSPEQVRATNRVDHRTDLWALGVIAFQCLTGRLPFNGEEVGEVLVEVCTAPIPAPSQLVPGLGPEVDRFFARALDRDLAGRFQSATELFDAFTALSVPASANVPAGPPVYAPTFVPAATPASGSAPAFAGSAPTPAPVSAPAFAPAAPLTVSAAAPISMSMPAAAITGASLSTLSPSEHTSHVVPARRGRGAVIAVAVVAGVLALGGIAFVASRAAAPTAATGEASSPTPEPRAAAPVPSSSTTVSVGSAQPTTTGDTPSATPPSSASAKPAAPSRDAPARPSNRKSPGKSKNGDDPLDHM